MTEPEVARAVFVPGLMGAGILLSAALLLADAVRRLTPNRGVRRKVVVARAVRAIVTDAARAAGWDITHSTLLRREPRSRWTYLSLGAALGSLAGLSVRAGTDAYFGAGRFQGNVWPLGAGTTVGALLGALAFLAFVLAAHRQRLPEPVEQLVASTQLGRLRPPPENRHERAHLLLPELSESQTDERGKRP